MGYLFLKVPPKVYGILYSHKYVLMHQVQYKR